MTNLSLDNPEPFSKPFDSSLLLYKMDDKKIWDLQGRYEVGNISKQNDPEAQEYNSAAGGVDFGYGYNRDYIIDLAKKEEFVWVTGDALCSPEGPCYDINTENYTDEDEVHGIQGMPKSSYTSVNSDESFLTQTYMIDTDINVMANGNKSLSEAKKNDATKIGDIEIAKADSPHTLIPLPLSPSHSRISSHHRWGSHLKQYSHYRNASHDLLYSHNRFGSHHRLDSHYRFWSHDRLYSHRKYSSHYRHLSHRKFGSHHRKASHLKMGSHSRKVSHVKWGSHSRKASHLKVGSHDRKASHLKEGSHDRKASHLKVGSHNKKASHLKEGSHDRKASHLKVGSHNRKASHLKIGSHNKKASHLKVGSHDRKASHLKIISLPISMSKSACKYFTRFNIFIKGS
ncbi:hypothetical protein [Legionella israelensis]|nr:hypothetical protein [Legionella israelensis]